MKVVTLLIDTLRYDFLGFNGNTWVQTPHLNRLAARSVVFDRAYLGSYPCMPARRDLWTGRFEFPFRGWGPLEYDDRDLAGVITGGHGITSMLITDHYHLWERGSGNYHFNFSGYDFIRGQEYDKWKIEPGGEHNPYPEKQAAHLPPGEFELNRRNGAFRQTERDYFPAQVMARAADWVEKNRYREDFFLLVDCFDPHEPFDPPRHYTDLYDPGYDGPEIIWPTYGWNRLTEAETRHVRALYAGEISLTDRWVGYLLDTLERLRLLDDTMIILATDHGHMFGEHGLMGKPWSQISDSNMYQEVSHIPLVIYHPRLPKGGKRVEDLVQLVDLYPTILSALGITPPSGIHGQNLLPLILGEESSYRPRDIACYGRFGEAVNITDGEWTLFIWPPNGDNTPLYWYSQLPPRFGAYTVVGENQPGRPHVRWPVRAARGQMPTQLFNVRLDPAQEYDQAPAHPEVVARLMQRAADVLNAVGAPIDQFERLGLPRRSDDPPATAR
jgi:arylsulfatase A-like enzyme